MLKIKDLYDIYYKIYNDKIEKKTKELLEITRVRNNLHSFFKTHTAILKEININLEELLELTDNRRTISFTGKVSISMQNRYSQYIRDLIFANVAFNRLSKELFNLKSLLVDYKTYKIVIRLYNKTKVKHLIEKGKTWNLGHRLGSLSIVVKTIPIKFDKNNNTIARINWPASKKNKQKIIDSGKIPYCKNTAPDGVPWLIAFTDQTQAYFDWRGGNNKFVANLKDMKFKPTVGTNGICKKLATYRRNNPEVDDYYIQNIK